MHQQKASLFWLSGFIILFTLTSSQAQIKYEKESRLPQKKAPQAAQKFISSIENLKRVRWFSEQSQAGQSVEAKFRYEKQKYSIEFDTIGLLQDVEIEIALSSLEKSVQENIEQYLSNTYQKHKIRKIQQQYSGAIPDLATLVQSKNLNKAVELRYECIIKAKSEEGWQLYEITFAPKGEHLKTAQVVLRNTDNLEY